MNNNKCVKLTCNSGSELLLTLDEYYRNKEYWHTYMYIREIS